MSGHGTIFKVGKRWALEISRGVDPVTGKRLRDRSYHDSPAAAKRARAKLVNDLHSGTYVAPSRLTLAEFLVERWLPAMESNLRRTTFHGYELVVTKRIVPHLGGVPLQQLTAAHLNSFYAHLLKSGRSRVIGERQAKGLSPSTVRQTHTIIRKALKDAMRWDLIPRNVADAADPPKQKSGAGRKQQPLTIEQLRAFLEVASADRLAALWQLAASTGMRRAELAGLTWNHVDLEAGRLTITESLLAIGREVFRDEPKTDSSRRTISLDPHTIDALRGHRARQAAERLAAGSAYVESDSVFRREDGTQIHPDFLLQRFRRLLKSADLPPVRLHDLRHTYATIGLTSNVHPKLMSQRLGHSSVKVTLDPYSHVEDRMDRETADALGALIAGSGYTVATSPAR